MIIEPKIRGFICTTAHPEGCAESVRQQVQYVQDQPSLHSPKRVLVVGSSTGYGLASRIVATFAGGADTIGVFFERPAADKRTATAGWYNTAGFSKLAHDAGHLAINLNGDAFSDEVKAETIEKIRENFGQVDLLIYSLASPRRTHPKSGETFSSVIKPIGKDFSDKTVNFHTGVVSDVTIEAATVDEIEQTVAVMGGEDWGMWVSALQTEGLLAEGFTTVAYSYVGPSITFPIYREGSIGRAKDDLEATALELRDRLQSIGGRAYVSINKAVVTQSSSAIPVVPLYMSLLFDVMKEKGIHEGCIEQMYRLFVQLYGDNHSLHVDDQSRIRLDDWEMRDDVQALVAERWKRIDSDNLPSLSDIHGYRQDFLHLFGFGYEDVDYEAETNPEVAL